MAMPLGDFNRGALVAPSFVVHGLRVAPNICYEDLFGEELAARFVDPLLAPHLMANLSNIGWFGESFAVQQHLQISRMRTLELQRPMLRATNTGATVVIDHRGVVTYSLTPHRPGVLVGEVDGRSGVTPYAAWSGRLGLWPLWVLACAVALICVLSARRRDDVGG
jgi:apolipoprotein N-acyltransferase